MLFWGHFHPLIVHLPIGFLLIAGLLELDRLTRRNSVSPHTITLILFWSAVSATLACVFGYMLSLGGGYEDRNAEQPHVGGHWRGRICLGGLVGEVRKSGPYFALCATHCTCPHLGVSLVFLLAAGHLGGNLTHGDDYLTQYMPETTADAGRCAA